MKKIITIFLSVALLLSAAGCAQKPAEQAAAQESASQATVQSSTQEPAEKTELLISAAASLTDCMEELKTLYAGDHPEVSLVFNFGSSGALQQQIEQGAPADVFVSAGKKQMSALQEKSLVGSVKDILENKVVLITPADGKKLSTMEDLTGADVEKIAVGEPESVPVGQYTAEMFANLGLTDALKDKLVFAKDVREVLSWVETGNVQAGLVYETDAKISSKVTICATAPEGSHKPVIYPVGAVKGSKHPAQAQAFVDFLFTPAAKEVFVKYGFSPLF